MKKNGRLVLETVEGQGLRFRAETDTNHTFILDSGADARAPSPIDALLAAVGACSGMDVISILRKKRQAVTGYTIELNGVRRDEHPRSFTHIETVHRVRGRGLDRHAIEDAVRLSETRYCAVHATVAPGVALSSRIEVEQEGS